MTNREFARALGRAMHRPSFIPAPAFALRLVLGEMADPLAITGQRVDSTLRALARVPFPVPGDRLGVQGHLRE